MTPEEKKAAQKTAKIIRAARKHANLTQSELADRLEVSQSAVSKLESGLLIPSVYQWFELCRVTQIPTDSHEVGYLDSLKPIMVQDGEFEGGFRLPKKYSRAKGSSVRSLQPFVLWLEQRLGEKKTHQVLKEFGVDPDFFTHYGHQISLRFGMDLVLWMIQKGYLQPKDLSALVRPVSQGSSHGELKSEYDAARDPAELLGKVLTKSKFYESNFAYTIESQQKETIDFSVTPEAHIREDRHMQNESFGDFLARYRKEYFSRIASYGELGAATVEAIENDGKGLERSVYRLRFVRVA